VASLVERIGTSAANAVDAFKRAASEFTTEYAWLQNNPPPMVVSREAMREYDSLLSRSRAIGITLQGVTKTIDAVLGAVWRTTGNDLAGMGAIPLIPVALVAGATATLISGVTAIRRFRERLKVFNEIRGRENIPADQAWKRAADAVAEPNTIERTVVRVAMVAGSVFLLALILRSKR